MAEIPFDDPRKGNDIPPLGRQPDEPCDPPQPEIAPDPAVPEITPDPLEPEIPAMPERSGG